jgi:hypothetical protein
MTHTLFLPPLSSPLTQAQVAYKRLDSINTTEFFHRISRPINTSAGEPYLYYASKVENFGELYFDMKPIDRFMVRETGAKDWERIETNVWIGPENATTHAHYDSRWRGRGWWLWVGSVDSIDIQ